MSNNNLPQLTIEKSFVNEYRGMLSEHAGRDYDKDRFFQSLYIALKTNDDLRACLDSDMGVASLLQAGQKAARIGLSIAPADGEAALIAYNGKVEYQIMTNGYRLLAEQTGQVETSFTDTIRNGDLFSLERRPGHEKGDLVSHTPDTLGENGTGEVKGAYAVIILKNGKVYAKAMGLKEIEEHKAHSKAKKPSSPWQANFAGMARKTAFKFLLKTVHIPELENILSLTDEDWQPPEPTNVTPKGMSADDIPGAIEEAAKPEPRIVSPKKQPTEPPPEKAAEGDGPVLF